ncbi:hypothetical protein FACS189427_09030 [Planctomycetales bacterium]|nr:hypothetical protein FACS189427_09030 [Planctomycetales bacterium]
MKHSGNSSTLLTCGFIAAVYIFLSFCTVPADAQSISAFPAAADIAANNVKPLDDNVKTFFDELISGASTSKTLDDWMRNNLTGYVAGSQPVEDTKTKLADVKTKFGEFRAYDRIDIKQVGSDLIIIRYLLKCDYRPVVWTFVFYRQPVFSGTAAPSAAPFRVIDLRFETDIINALSSFNSTNTVSSTVK